MNSFVINIILRFNCTPAFCSNWVRVLTFNDGGLYHKETISLICMMRNFVMKDLKHFFHQTNVSKKSRNYTSCVARAEKIGR